MIMLLGGTKDSRELIDLLLEQGYIVAVTTATAYGASLVTKHKNCLVLPKRMNREEMQEFIINNRIKLVVDATHPYAVEVSNNAIKACENVQIPYLRYQRQETGIKEYTKDIQYCADYVEAAKTLLHLQGNILLTTGSKTLRVFSEVLGVDRLFVRVLPTSDVVKSCEALGLKPSHIIAMQGPFSVNMNMEIMKKYKIHRMVTKESGDVGGTAEKLEAAHKLGIPIVMIGRPLSLWNESYENVDQLMDKVREIYG